MATKIAARQLSPPLDKFKSFANTVLLEGETDNDPTWPVFEIRRSEVHSSVTSKPVGLKIVNQVETPGGTGYQNEIVIQLKAGVTESQRRYIQFVDYDDTTSGFMGFNSINGFTIYNAKDIVHNIYGNTIINGGNFSLKSSGNGSIDINNNYYNDEPNTGKGGVKIFDGQQSRLQFFQAKDGQTIFGYETASTVGYQSIFGGKTYSGAQRGAILIVDPLTPANYTTFYGVRVFNPASITGVQVVAFLSDVVAGSSRYGVFCSGTAISRFNGSIGIGGESFGGGTGVLFLANTDTVPTTNPVNGGIIYVEGGQLKYRGSSGTITILGAA